MHSELVPGAVFPDYQLPDHTSTLHRLSELQGDDPMILTLSRGHYCPKEHQRSTLRMSRPSLVLFEVLGRNVILRNLPGPDF
jgi:peroxiredoxin